MSHPLDQFSPETGDKPIPMVEVSINVSFDVLVKLPEDYNKDDLKFKGEMFRQRYDIKEQVSNVEINF